MTILGVDDKHTSLPRIGKVKSGIKVKKSSGKEYPEEKPYFILNPIEPVEERGKPVFDKLTKKPMVRINEDVQRAVDFFGTDTPAEMIITFPMDPLEHRDLCYSSNLKWWGAGTMKCIGDNESAHYTGTDRIVGLNDPSVDTSKLIAAVPVRYANRKCSMDTCPQYISGACKAEINLRFLIPGVSKSGVFQLDTKSWQAVTEIGTSLELIKNDLLERGYKSLAYVPLRMFKVGRKNTKSRGGENFIIQIRLAENEIIKEEKLIAEGAKSYISFAHANANQISLNPTPIIEPIRIDEPDYDLLPQSTHGTYQTGDDLELAQIVNPEAIPKVDGPTVWLEDPQIQAGFKKLAELLSTQITPAKMMARAMKMRSKEDLLNYLVKEVNKRLEKK